MAAAREFPSLEDIILLFKKGDKDVFDFLTLQALQIDDMHCDKIFDAETGVGEINQMTKVK
jgi:hypothetical protein